MRISRRVAIQLVIFAIITAVAGSVMVFGYIKIPAMLGLGIVLFVLVHVFMVLVSGVWNNLRSMITGRYAVETPEGRHAG